MIFNYLKLAVRLLIRNPFFTFINILGLSIGFAAFFILWPYSQTELKSDQFHKDYDRIARLSRNYTFSERDADLSIFLPIHNSGIARQILNDYDEVIDLTRIIPQQFFETFRQGFDKDLFVSILTKKSTKEFYREHTLAFADPNFFQFFSFPLISGDPKKILVQPYSVVISEKNARKYFGDSDPINKVIHLNDSIPLTVTGVFENLPRNTHMVFDMLISTAGMKGPDLTGWLTNWFGYCYIKVSEGTDFNVLENTINKRKKEIYGICPRCPAESSTSIFIQPLKEIVFTNLRANTFTYKSQYLLIILGWLAFVILILAWINYVSISIHMLRKRVPEMVTRKVVGAGGKDFALQFLMEAVIINALSFLIALTFVQLVKTPIEAWLNFYTINWTNLSASTIWIVLIMLGLGIGVTSTYPILISMRKKSILLLKKSGSGQSPLWINAIVTGQYTAAIALLIWICTVYFQLDLVLSKTLGIEKEGVLVVDCPLELNKESKSKLEYFINNVSSLEGIKIASVSKTVIGDMTSYGVPLQRNKNDKESGFDSNGGVDENFLSLYGIKLLHGRNFQPNKPSDQKAIMLSSHGTIRLGFLSPEEAIGAKLIFPWQNHNDVEVIGVYQDYEFRPFFTSQLEGNRGSFLSYKDHLIPDFYPSKISVKINLNELHSSIGRIEKFYKEVFPHETFRSTFLDDHINKHYASEKIARNQITIFTFIAIGISCLGLLGLISNKVVEKTKEIGIRKVLGAELVQIAQILLNTTIKQISTAIVISIPLAYYLTQQYLLKFSERIALQWWHYALPVAMIILILLSTVATVIWRAAKSNPVEALKYE